MASSKMPRALRATTADIGEGRYPRALLVACVSWVLLGVVLLLSRVGAPESTDEQETNAATGVTAVRAPTADQSSFVDYLPWLGVIVIVLALVLGFGFGAARLVLALLGLLAVVGLAVATPWLAIPAAVLFVVGAVCSVLVSVHRYVTRPRTDGAVDPASPRVVS